MATKYPGLALMAGMVLIMLTSMLLPWMTFMTIISLLLMSYGLLGLYPAASQQAGFGGRMLQFGIIISVIEWSILIIVGGMRHFVIHMMQRSELPADGSLTSADFEQVALGIHTTMTSVGLTLYALFPLASILLGIGLSKRFDSMGIYKSSSLILAIGGVLGLIIFLTAMNAPDFGLSTMLNINNTVLSIMSITLIIIGYGMYREREEFAP